MAAYCFMKVLSWLVCRLPRGAAEVLGRGLARALWPFVPRKRKLLAKGQIIDCLQVSEAEAERISRESALRFGPMLMEVLRFPVIKGHIEDYVTLTGAVEEARAHLATGKGCIFSTSHTGNWELMGGALAQYGLPLVGVAKKQKAQGMDRFINEYRSLIGMHITYTQGVREMYELLNEGWIIGLIGDQDPSRRDGIILDFFGRPTNCVTGPASMARFKDVPIFPVCIHRRPDGHHILNIEPPVRVEKTKDKREDIRRVSQFLTSRIEAQVREHPEEWFWLHDRWKSIREEF